MISDWRQWRYVAVLSFSASQFECQLPTCSCRRRRVRFSLGNFQLTLPAKSTLPFSSLSTVGRLPAAGYKPGRSGLEKSLHILWISFGDTFHFSKSHVGVAQLLTSSFFFPSARVASAFRRLITDQRSRTSICLCRRSNRRVVCVLLLLFSW